MSGKNNITVRKQKIRKNHTKAKLVFFLVLTALLLFVAAFAKYLCPYDPYAQDLALAQKLAGTAIGIFCGWKGGKADTVLMRISDLFLAFPGLVFALAVAGVLGGGIQNAIIALAVISWPKFARLARGLTLTQKDSAYLMASKLSGSSTGKLLLKHILPNIAGPILVTSVLDIGTMMMELAGLSFLGLGVKPPMAEWGSMINDGRSMLQISPWMVLAPGLAIFITVMIFNLLGDTIRDYMDPKERNRRRG